MTRPALILLLTTIALVILSVSAAIPILIGGQFDFEIFGYSVGMGYAAVGITLYDRQVLWVPQVADFVTGLLALLLWLAIGSVASFDLFLFQWSPNPRFLALMLTGLAIFLIAGIASLATPLDRTRPTERGLYRWVREPHDACRILAVLGGALALGSWPSFIPVLGLCALNVYRAVRKDRFARRAGWNEAYAERVRYLLLPGVF